MEKEEKIKLTGFACQKCRREISKEEGEFTEKSGQTKSKFIIELENDLRVNRCDLEKYFIIHVPSELKILGKTGNSLTARMETALYKDLNKVINNGKTEMRDGISHRDFYLNFKAADYQDFSTREEAVRFLRTSDTYFQQIK
ncbi:21714_t:CDS:2 [Gigaspora margarita]|uniref:21714_t:CDS:1 n=1 Tax=Gigaspora margarita TaxID=4874 RepID=A0ABM8VV94_GIGMA|nr:21714_t:CDS:2 [Gigaspora margarita]